MIHKNFNLKKPIMIAEIGINHNGSLALAKKLIDLAKKYNFDCVKFQKRTPEICVPKEQALIVRDTPWGNMSYLNYKKKIEFSRKQYDEINSYCKKVKIKWLASAWDIESQIFLKKYKSKYNKIASAMVTNMKFVDFVAKEKKHTFISTGMTNISDIKRVVKIFKKRKCKFTLLHCVSSYPAKEENLNLNTIITLKKKFNCEVGYSGHEASVSPSVYAYIAGATVIERHITLNRAMWGTDQSASLAESGIKILFDMINKAQKIFGSGKKIKTIEDKKIEKKFRYWIKK